MTSIQTLLPTALIIISVVTTSCSPRNGLPLEGPLTLTEEELHGQKIFMEHCQRCHPGGEGGLGPAINPVPGFAKSFQVRHGLGVMPAFDKEIISATELDAMISYLKALKNN